MRPAFDSSGTGSQSVALDGKASSECSQSATTLICDGEPLVLLLPLACTSAAGFVAADDVAATVPETAAPTVAVSRRSRSEKNMSRRHLFAGVAKALKENAKAVQKQVSEHLSSCCQE